VEVIRRRAYARAGLMGNPSDGYGGKTISFTIPDFCAEVVLYVHSVKRAAGPLGQHAGRCAVLAVRLSVMRAVLQPDKERDSQTPGFLDVRGQLALKIRTFGAVLLVHADAHGMGIGLVMGRCAAWAGCMAVMARFLDR